VRSHVSSATYSSRLLQFVRSHVSSATYSSRLLQFVRSHELFSYVYVYAFYFEF